MESKNRHEMDLKTLLDRIASDPSRWVLILGDRVSYHKPEEHKKILSDFANEARRSYGDNPIIMPQIYRYNQDEEYVKLQGVLFGDIWNATSFMDELKEKQVKWREDYAKRMARTEDINIDYADVNLKNVLSAFNGLILTTCQDETVEAFLEYERSMPVTDMVCTPYILTTTQEWYKRIQTSKGEFRHRFPKEDANGNMHALIKLYGSCSDSHRMLLSEQDFQEYYPVGVSQEPSASEPKTVSFLREIFSKKNLLLLGMDSTKDNRLFAQGIDELLERTWSGNTERIILVEDKSPVLECLKRCHLDYIKCREMMSEINELKEEAQKIEKTKECERSVYGEVIEASEKVLNQEEAMEQFWNYYSRRSYKNFYSEEELADGENYAEREAYVLETKILGYGEGDTQTKQWTAKSIKQLAIAANNLADFYDLEKCFHLAEKELENEEFAGKGRDSTQFYEQVTQKLLVARLSSRSLWLHQILSFYGSGFPLGFLFLLSENDEELKKWKQAGIQLTNSGIYIKRQHRKNLHERMSYADSIMEKVGENPYKKDFENRIKAMERAPGDSYFYPFDNKIEGQESQDKIDELFERMLCKLHDILRDKSRDYRQMRSLLQTEMPSIVGKIGVLNDTNFRWKPALIYYLVCESRGVPTDSEVFARFQETLDNFLKSPYLSHKENGDLKSNQEIFSGRVMISLAKIAMECQSYDIDKQNAAREGCAQIEKLFDEQERVIGTLGEMPDIIFKQKMRVYLMESRISGRISTIEEIGRCKNKYPECTKQRMALEAMRKYLDRVQKQMGDRERARGTDYKGLKAEWNHLMGEYYFKQSQFYKENTEYGGRSDRHKEGEMYKNSEEYYREALDFYNRYPDQYWIQRADVMRSLADLYCQKGKSLNEASLKGKSYKLLMDAYMLYRSNFDLHGVADVLQSMGNLEDFKDKKVQADSRSPLCFYKAAKNLYTYLGDEWSWNVVIGFEDGLSVDREKKLYSKA